MAISKTIKTSFKIDNFNKSPPKTSLRFSVKMSVLSMDRIFKDEDFHGHAYAHYMITHCNDMDKAYLGDGQQIFEGTVCGKHGSFAMKLHCQREGNLVNGKLEILPETCMGELKGLTGHGTYRVDLSERKLHPEGKCEIVVKMP